MICPISEFIAHSYANNYQFKIKTKDSFIM